MKDAEHDRQILELRDLIEELEGYGWWRPELLRELLESWPYLTPAERAALGDAVTVH